MINSIEYLGFDNDLNSYIYKLIDTEFECEVSLSRVVVDASSNAALIALVIRITVMSALEYKKRNYSHDEIVRNLFKCNIYICNKFNHSFEKELSCQLNHIDTYYKDISFAKLYYDDIKAMWDKRKVFI